MEEKHLPFNKSGQVSNPTYVQGDINADPLILLEQWYSKSELKRLRKQNGILISKEYDALWIKIGQQFIIIRESIHFIALQAQIWWEYHFQLKPKSLVWKKITEQFN